MNSKLKPYQEFANDNCHRLTEIQDNFRAKYSIDNYANWYYTQASEILRLYSDDKEIFFKYIPVGTFSRNTNSWLWAWSNEDSVEPRKLRTLKIKELGDQLGYDKLKIDHFEGDEYIGWELTSIAFYQLGGIGTYRVISDHFEKYFIITDEINKSEVEKIESNLIECDSHGLMRTAFICQHLNNSFKTGFEEAFDSYKGMELEEDDEFQAWCADCETQRLRTDGWNDESMNFAKIKIVCEGCYFVIKEFNVKEEH